MAKAKSKPDRPIPAKKALPKKAVLIRAAPKKALPKKAAPKKAAPHKAAERTDTQPSPAPAVTGAALGIDIGGTGVKAALIDVTTGELLSRRYRVNTPKPATPDAVAKAVQHVVGMVAAERKLPAELPVGVGIPGPIKDGRVMTAANIDKRWIGASAEELLGKALGRRVYAINDADGAGLAEMAFGPGRKVPGTVLMLTLGTGIGSGLFVDGRLVPNTEMGHLEWRGRDVELRLSGAARERRSMRWRAWANEFSAFLERLEIYFWPDLIILGGGVSKELKKYEKWLKSRAKIVPARFLNTSGIVGAAMYASDRVRAESARPVQLVPAGAPRASRAGRARKA
ncbi:MAG: polyphosphate glucokinase [Chloroflexota bacterium]|jgi:polyphosphate glucokinase|nr:polyphosphate glucokinase [Chloroflexota bacterium]